MSELDSEKNPQKNDSEDEELEKLSEEEKAAFEKIMAEIASSNGGPPQQADAEAALESQSADEHSAQAEEVAPAVPPSDDGVYEANAPQESPGTTDAENSIGQQAALDQIMAEIESTSEDGKADGVKNAEDQAVSPDQQAALDQILAEIESKRKGEKIGSRRESVAENEGEERLSKDQQAALGQILSEIEEKRKGGKKDVAPAPPGDREGDDLSGDQQAALDRIMTEIKSKDASVNEPAETSAPQEADTQADVEKILAEIEAKKARESKDGSPVSSADQKADPAIPNADDEAKEIKPGLTLEEFDDELSHLLSEAKTEPVPKRALKSKHPAAAADSVVVADTAANDAADAANPGIAADAASNHTADAKMPQAGPTVTPLDAQTHPSYPVLQEVQAESDSAGKAARKSKRTNPGGSLLRRPSIAISLITVLSLIILGAGTYWAHQRIAVKPVVAHVPDDPTALSPRHVDRPVSKGVPAAAEKAQPKPGSAGGSSAPVKEVPELETPATMLAGLKMSLSAALSRIQQKAADIEELKSYYHRGVDEDAETIQEMLPNGSIPSLEKALSNKGIELELRSIQRRKTYAAKLETPSNQLKAISEELLYLQRRAHIYEILSGGIDGLPIEKFKKNVAVTISSYMNYYSSISIDDVAVRSPSLASIWEELASGFKQKANLLAQRAPLNRAISAEICKGDYERKYQLTALSEEAARCLAKWSGKDMYLNELTELTPEAAKILVQWPGEWLSLNGIKELSGETAKYLSEWPGQRLSLNGLTALSPEATGYLSKWRGAQLEMIGLHSIGPWKNYGTRLFLSETLQRQLEAQ